MKPRCRLISRSQIRLIHNDCTGTHVSGDGTQHYNFVVSPDGSKLEFIETDAGTVITGTITRMTN